MSTIARRVASGTLGLALAGTASLGAAAQLCQSVYWSYAITIGSTLTVYNPCGNTSGRVYVVAYAKNYQRASSATIDVAPNWQKTWTTKNAYNFDVTIARF